MSEKASGQSNLNFEFFEELDEIFKKDPNIVPVALASSSTYKSDLTKQRNETLDQSDDNLNISTEADTDKTQKNLLNPRQKKRHSNRKKIVDQLAALREDLNQREINRQRRHEENLLQKREL